MRERVAAWSARGPGQHVGIDVPLDVRADPAQPGVAAAGPELELLQLRRRRFPPPAADDRQGHGARHQEVLAAAALQQHLQPQERADRAPAGRRRRPPRPPTISPRIVADVYAEYQRRLRAANALDFDDLIGETVAVVQAFLQIAAVLPAALPPHPRRRVPGHQPRAVRAGA